MSRKSNIIKFLMDEQGLELSEYAVAAALVALATVAAFTVLISSAAQTGMPCCQRSSQTKAQER